MIVWKKYALQFQQIPLNTEYKLYFLKTTENLQINLWEFQQVSRSITPVIFILKIRVRYKDSKIFPALLRDHIFHKFIKCSITPSFTKTRDTKINMVSVLYYSVCSVTYNSLQPHGLQLARLLCPWDFPGKNITVGCHFLLQGIFLTQGSNLCLLHWGADSSPLSHLGFPASLYY